MTNSNLTPSLRLTVTCMPYPDESLPGFLMRLAKQARLPNAAYLAKVAGLATPSAAYSDADFSPLAELVGVGVEILEAISYRPTGHKAHHCFRNGVVHRKQLDTFRRRACTACLSEEAYHQARWDLALSGCCSKHGLRLVSSCWECDTKLGWQSSNVDRCGKCGADLTAGPRVEVSEAEAAAAADLFSLASGELCDWLPAALRPEDRSILVYQVMALGFMAVGWESHRRPETLAAAGLEHVVRIAAAGIAALRGWPVSLVPLMEDELSKEDERHVHYGARKALGEMYTWLVNLPDGSMRQSAVLTASEFLARDKLRGHRMRRSELFRGVGSSGTTIKEAALALHVTPTKLKRLAAGGFLTLSHVEGSGRPAMVDEAQLAALVALKPYLIDFQAACRLMGVAIKKLRPLVEANLIPFVHRASQDGQGIWAFDSNKLLELLRQLEGDTPMGRDASTVGFNTALEAFRLRGVDLVAFFRLLLDGDLKPVAIAEEEVGLKRLLFSKAGVRAACRARDADTGFLSFLAVSEALGVSWWVIKQLTTAGVLPTVNEEVPVAEVERFRREVVSCADLAREVGDSPRYLAIKLNAEGIQPITGPGVDGGRQNFYRRTEELLDALRVVKKGPKSKTSYVVDNEGQI